MFGCWFGWCLFLYGFVVVDGGDVECWLCGFVGFCWCVDCEYDFFVVEWIDVDYLVDCYVVLFVVFNWEWMVCWLWCDVVDVEWVGCFCDLFLCVVVCDVLCVLDVSLCVGNGVEIDVGCDGGVVGDFGSDCGVCDIGVGCCVFVV